MIFFSNASLNVPPPGKHLLSLSEDVSIQCESLWEGIDFTTSLSRMRFDSMIGDTIQGIIQQTEAMLAKLDVKPEDVHKVSNVRPVFVQRVFIQSY